MAPASELESYEYWLIGHLEWMLESLRKMSPEHWDWTPDQAAPTPRTVAIHTWQWLMCDRQHIEQPSFAEHQDVAEAPEDIEAICSAFAEETEQWRVLLRRLTPENLDEARCQFGNESHPLNVRWFIGHMLQNVIYKHGQISEVYFALGYDGTEQYAAPFPNQIYAAVRAAAGSS